MRCKTVFAQGTIMNEGVKKKCLELSRSLVWILVFTYTCEGSSVTKITPHYGSLAGETRVTVEGSGFVANPFSMNHDPDVGNTVYLLGDSGRQYSCPVLADACTTEQIICYTPRGMMEENHYVKVKVNGVLIDDEDLCAGAPSSSNCTYKPRMGNTPTIDTLSPKSGELSTNGTMMTLTGNLYTDVFGSNRATATNGKTEQIKRVYVGPNPCQLKDANNTFFGLSLADEESNHGTLICNTNGTSVGCFNVTFIVDPPYGRSLYDAYHVTEHDKICMFESYTVISSISHSNGSKEGGLILTINGNNFDNRAPYVEPKAYVGDTECIIQDVIVDGHITCEVAADPNVERSSYPGNRGIIWEFWNDTVIDSIDDLDDIRSLSSSSSGYTKNDLDEFHFFDANDTMDNYTSIMRTFFTPPHSGDYEIYFYADEGGKLFIDNVEAVTSEKAWETSGRKTLDKNQRYKVEVFHFEKKERSEVQVKAKYFNTSLTSASTSKVVQEKQNVIITSAVEFEEQELEFLAFDDQTGVQELQTVEVNTTGKFRFGIYGVYTEPLTTAMEPVDIQDSINAIPIFGNGESVTLTRSQSASPTYHIEYNSYRGDFPDIEVVSVVDNPTVQSSVTEVRAGEPSNSVIALSYAGIVSDPFPVSDLATKLEGVVTGMFQTKCPKVFVPSTAKYSQGFESASSQFSGARVDDTDPFCGRYCLMNPYRIFRKLDPDDDGILLASYGKLCFAYKGFLQNFIRVSVTYKSSNDFQKQSATLDIPHTFKTDSDTQSEKWYYTCEDINAKVTAEYSGATEHRLDEVRVNSQSSVKIGYVDDVVIGPAITTDDSDPNLRRRQIAHPNGAHMRDIQVSSISSTKYKVTLKPYECGNGFPLFQLANGRVTAGNAAFPSTSATSTLYHGTGKIKVDREVSASPPVSGNVTLKFKGVTKSNLNITLEPKDFGTELGSLNGTGSLHVTKEGDCANFNLSVTFLTLSGDQEQMELISQGTSLQGRNPNAGISTVNDGGLFYDLTGDMAKTVHEIPQVRLYINDVLTACSTNCAFQWLSSATPNVTSVAPTSGTSALNTSIVISGTGFNADPTKNKVTIANVTCAVTASTSTTVTCSVGNGPVGEHKIMVDVDGKGYAGHPNGVVNFEYTADIDGISPTSGSIGGGTLLAISGYGFKNGASASIGSAACNVTSVKPDQIICVTSLKKSGGTHAVQIVQGSNTLSYSSFTYESSLTAVISSFTPSSLGALGGRLTISGSSFTSTMGSVHVGNVAGNIASWTDSQIEVDVEGVPAGIHELNVATSYGRATDGNGDIPTIDVDLSVTNVFPLKGSISGGTELTITGSGFGTNATLVDVRVGDVECEVATVTNEQIVCGIVDAATTHSVTNRGTSADYGIFYAFDEPYIKINAGDSVTWSWETPDIVNDVAHAIIEIESPSATEAKVGGFSSGTPSKNGQYTKKFTETGTYYVWSGYVDPWNIKHYAGTVEVENAQSRLGEISVMVGNIDALHKVGGAADPSDSSSCKSVTTGIDTCSDNLPTGGDSSKFNFAFWTCSTPTVNSIDVNNGTVQSAITISGEGLSSTDCQNEITFGDFNCEVTSSSDTMVSCNFAKFGEPDLGVLYPLDVRVGNRGNALIVMSEESKGFGLIPNVDAITPTYGSLAGGAHVTITGFGFGDSPLVYIGSSICEIIENSYTEIICENPASSEGESDIEVQVYVNGNPLTAVCETPTMTCRFTYANLWTPLVTAIDPDSMSGTTTVTVTGESLGTTPSDLDVTIGGTSATVISALDTSLTASIDNIPAGDNDVFVRVKHYGKALGSLKMYGTPNITTVTPSSGSVNGETVIAIQGNGFVVNDTAVAIDGTPCVIISTSLSEITCETQPHAAALVSVSVTSNGVSYPSSSFTFSETSTPTVTSVSPASGLSGETLTIYGSNFGDGDISVTLGDADCIVTSRSSTGVQCTLGSHPTGAVPVSVYADGLGRSNTDQQFEYQLSLNSILPTVGGTGGGQTVVLSGSGFEDSATATICGLSCVHVETTSSAYTCRSPANTAQTCDVSVSVNGLTKTLAGSYTYDAALTPTLSNITPTRGGTGGGKTITITGSGFGSVVSDVNVMIDGSECAAQTVTSTEISCVTGPHSGSVDAKVEVQVSGNGVADEVSVGDADFSYIDVWSSLYTWGGASLPQQGEFIIVPSGMTLLLDTDTPVLSFLLIQGKLLFDEKDVELKAKIIMITDGGLLQVGTESQPFQHKGIITLYGANRDKELPIYGTKVLAVRNGTLDLHGIEVPLTWTRLASTASSGSSTIILEDPVDWNADDEIVIASTGHKHSQSENEKHTIASISSDKRTLTLYSPLEDDHWGTQETFDGTNVEFRAEVGLLTHNVVVRGNTDVQWEDEIEACEAGFDTGEFATQTCFLGRFGDETGSSEFGGMILVHAPVLDTHEAQARISYTEVTFAGQAFRLGRYPIHFHLNGDMSTSYVRGCGIHKTFNRAVNIHGTHNTLVEKTVIYNIMGGAFFLEDGIETGNTIQQNLAVFVKASSGLLNDDVTPASYWVTNPNNTIQHNAAAGGSHFGYWYRMHDHPEGPSYTKTVCPKGIPLGVFLNNSAHSFGWFGLWIFPDYFPKKEECGGTEVEPAVFDGLYAWNNDKGAEAVNSGALQFKNFVLVQNKLAGYEGKLVFDVPLYTDDAPMIADSLIVGTTTVIPDPKQGCSMGGIIFPYGGGFRAKDITFVNFGDSSSAAMRWTRIDGTCGDLCGGWSYYTEGLTFVNSPNKAAYDWEWEGIIVDTDGTATGKAAGWAILPTTPTLPTDCESAPDYSVGIAASMCPSQYSKWHRFSFNEPSPESLKGRNFLITNQYGTSSCPFAEKRITHGNGWVLALLDGATYAFEFEDAGQINNISFTGRFDHFEADEYVLMETEVDMMPDRFSFDGGATFINATVGGIDPATAVNGDWEWDNTNSKVKFIVHGNKRSKRGSPGIPTYSVDRPVRFTAYKCYYEDCIPPPDPDTVPPATERPLDFDIWDDTALWNNSNNDSFVSNIGGSYGLPQNYDNVRIAFGTWVVVNKTTPFSKLATLLLEGVLEFIDTPGAVYELEADFIIIKAGRLIIGWPDDAFDGLATITLRGNHSSPYYYPGDGPILGSKAIGVFGGLDLFGKDVGLTWTELATTATAGSNAIVVADPVQWSQGDEIVVGPTGFDPWQTESFKIESVASDNVTLTLNETLKYLHTAHQETLSNGQKIKFGAAVGLLSRNIKIVGEDYSDMYQESFGARVLVGLVTSNGQAYTGYARLSNVEFYHTGQEGFTDEYDPRYSLAYLATGTVSNVKPSFVSKCSFHNGFSTAIGAFGISSLDITDNVIFGAIGHGLRTSSSDTRLVNNLLALVVSTASYQDRFEVYDYASESGIEAITATDLTLQGNLVTGAERIAFHVPPQDCDDTSDRYKDNKAYANVLGGVVVVATDALTQSDCARISGHTVWKTHDFGIYYQNEINFLAENNLLIENTNGIFPIILKPASLPHAYADKSVQVRSTTFVGETSSFSCSNDVTPSNDDNYKLSSNARPSRLPSKGMVGLIFTGFYSKDNGLPSHPWIGIMSYPALGGITILNNVTFAKYKSSSCKSNFAVSTNFANDDLMHPVESSETSMFDVDETNKILYHKPNVGKINSADCVDMDCDGHKKALFKDLDGTFLGHPGSVISQSEYEWGGDPRRGLGDYRIPETMVTDSNGNRIPYDTLMPHKGIIRNDNCTYQSSWQAYECKEDLNYELLVIESMDEDTETRRLSPVALLSDGYIDLINGPQDQGWCSGYTCRLRLSTFFALVATGKECLVHFTSVTPKHIRYRLLNAAPADGIKFTLWYSRSNRLDVYVDDDFVLATNARIDSNGRYIISSPQGNEFEPQIANGTGTNFFDKDKGELTIIIRGSQRIDVKTQESVIVTFGIPALTVAQFFGDNIVENIANFLNIPLTKVRVVNVVSASSSGRRKKRSSDGIVVEIEIGDEPVSSLNGTAPDTIDYTELTEIASSIVDECQAGNITDSFNVSGSCELVDVPSLDAGTASVQYNTPIPDHLFFYEEPVSLYEGNPLQIQPKIRMADITNNVVTELGTAEFPWQLNASLRGGTGHPDAVLNGTLSVYFSDGWFNFTDLEISHMGTGYVIDFNVTYPTQALDSFYLASNPFDVPGRSVKVNVFGQTAGDIVRYARFSVTLDLRDATTDEVISDIAWRDHTWTAEVRLLAVSSYATLDGHLTSDFDTSTGRALFPDLNMTGFGIYYLQLLVVSNPPDYSLTLNHKLNVKHPSHVGMTVEEEFEIKVKFDTDFHTMLPTEDEQNAFEQMILTEFANTLGGIHVSNGFIWEGSISVTFIISGTYGATDSAVNSLCDIVNNQTHYSYNALSLTLSPYMTVNNETYYGVKCYESDTDDDDDDDDDEGMPAYLIAVIVILSILVVAAIIVLVIWRLSVKSKTNSQLLVKPARLNKMSEGVPAGTFYKGHKSVEDFLFREDSQFSISQAPLVTTLDYEKRPMSGFSLRVSSPEPFDISKLMEQHPPNGEVHPPPAFKVSQATHPKEECRIPIKASSSSLHGGQESRPHTAVSDRESPLPPVGQSLYNIDYI